MFRSLTKLTAFGLIVGLVLGWAQSVIPIFDSFTHFRLHLCLLLALVMLRLLWKKRWQWLSASAVALGVSLVMTGHYLPINNLPESTTDKDTLKVVQFNTRYDNTLTETALQSLLSVDADVYILQELNSRNFDILRGLLPSHPFHLECTKPRRAGTGGIISRIPFDPAFESDCQTAERFSVAKLKTVKGLVTVSTLHLSWPWPGTQHGQLDRLAERLESIPGERLILAGDFNAAPWSHAVQRVATMTRTKVAPGVKLTWEPRFPSLHLPIGLILPIDQIMARGAKPVSRRVLSFAGSDHRPVLTHFVLE